MEHMQRAVQLAGGALGATSPNPAVGAVLVRDGRIVGEGYTRPPGGPHAEAVALAEAGELAHGATLYVTLEPCAHHGQTPPCTDAIIRAGVAEVRAALRDPNPAVRGGGMEALEAAGVRVALGEGADEARSVLEGYLHWIATGLPLVVAKFAMSLDGKIATAAGESQWITGEEARRRAHELRAAADAVMVGVGTALQDDPRLTTRDASGRPADRQPLRVVVDSGGRVPPSAQVFAAHGSVMIAVADATPTREQALREAGADVFRLPAQDGRVDVRALLGALGERGVTSLLVEGGGDLLASLFEGRMVDRVEAFVAPMIIGGRDARTPVEGEGVPRLAEALRLNRVTVERLGEDIHIIGYPQDGG